MTVQESGPTATPWRALIFSLVNAGAIFVPHSTHSNSTLANWRPVGDTKLYWYWEYVVSVYTFPPSMSRVYWYWE
eukprot:1347403-Prymnesium_polylepis.1